MHEISQKDYLNVILAFDYGEARVGVAIKPAEQVSAEPLVTLSNDSRLMDMVKELVDLHSPGLVIVGWPRSLDAEKTQQTEKAEQFASQVAQRYNIKVELQDEALSTQRAEAEIPRKFRGDRSSVIDQYAACVILEDYLQEKSR